MGSSDKDTGVFGCSVGSIVWVRRRNGSWWPGKILGAEELSAAHLMSPRSGTPVKLLGREDASVDWYNLEKSKRVKSFRCGEFDDCIERAETSLGMPPKKREKYARREDAILHALELEKKLLEEQNGKSGCSSNGKSSKSSDPVEKEFEAPAECLGNDDSEHMHSKSEVNKLDSSIEDKSMNHPLYVQEVKEESLLAGDEDNSEIIPRMRGLRDLGLKIAHSKQKLSSSVTLNGSQKPEFDSNACAFLDGGLSTESTVHANNKIYLDKRKKTHEMLNDESIVRRRDRRRPLVQVLQSSAKLPLHHSLQHNNNNISIQMSGDEQTEAIPVAKRSRCISSPGESSDCSDDKQFGPKQTSFPSSQLEESNFPHPAALDEENTTDSAENTETDTSATDSLDSEADEEMMALSDADVVIELEPKSLRRSEAQVQYGSMSSDEPDGLALASDMSHLSPSDPVSTCVGVSKWQLKGKRNIRGFAKRSTALTDRRVSRGSMCGTSIEESETNACDEPDLIEKNFRSRRGAYDSRGYLLTSKSTSKGSDDFTHNIINWEDLAWNDEPVVKGYWEDSRNYFDPVFGGRQNFGGRRKSLLVDVDLKVQSSYQREHVPMISLMSKLNGQAIVGHPIQIEALENGSSEMLLSAADGICPDTSDNDTALPPMWRTARRTANFRVPRPHPSATLDGEETVEHFQYSDQEKKVQLKKSKVWSSGQKASTTRKSISHAPRPPLDKKYSRKPPKKISLSSSQKIKTLSSIGTEQKLGNDLRHGTIDQQVDGLIKGGSGPTTVACIPVKLVYSRLYEELVGRHQ
ncbi:PWWP domain protein [Actinidia chinensis var. chinensis]|uniref:PWWP domain protein n=1 Tax=Actinidia chinensis var. chinensis TaxID=1590841 RepID=A0A2R6RSG5_ACTCC|nr:PWWP domain protein [Actinidia chinensis var. chinensis]